MLYKWRAKLDLVEEKSCRARRRVLPQASSTTQAIAGGKEASAYLRYLEDVPGREDRKLKCVTLGKFRTLTLAEQAAREYMQLHLVNDRQVQEQSITSLTFREQAEKFLTALTEDLYLRQPTTPVREQSTFG